MRQITTVEDYQLAAAKIASRVRRDSGFAEKLRADPLETLKALGVGTDAARELVSEDASLRHRAGIGHATAGDCEILSCVCTNSCCVTCWTTTDLWVTGNGSFRDVHFGAVDSAMQVSPEREMLLDRIIERGHLTIPD